MDSFARLLTTIPLVSYFFAILILWTGLPINGFIFPGAVCASVIWTYTEKGLRSDLKWVAIIVALVVLTVSIVISMYIYDWSYDGQWYHICTIKELVNDWNPVFNTSVNASIDEITALWVEHYPRGIESIAATISACTGNLDAGKALNMWFVMASVVYIYIFLQDCLPTMNRYMRWWIALVVALNPVVIVQLFTYYIDWSLYTLLIIFLVNLYLFFEKGIRRALYLDMLLLFFIPAIKLNIFFWIVLWGGVAFFFLLWKSRYKYPYRLTAICAVVVLAGIGIGGYNPYLTNWKEHDTPFYPLMGKEKVDIFDSQVLPVMRGKSNSENVLMSLVANPSNNMNSDEVNILGISKNNLTASSVSDARIGGFGIFFFESILLSIILFICSSRSRRIVGYLCVLVGLLASLFILPHGYWARYVGFFYLFPLIMLFYFVQFGLKSRFTRGLYIVTLSLLSFDILVSLSGVVVQNIVHKETVDYVLNQMEDSQREVELSTCNYSFIDKMERRAILYSLSPVDKMKDKLNISCPIYLNCENFDFETNQPWIFSLYSSFRLKCEPNELYKGADE